eukprot:scaffold29883_cov48-Attheya_sp.AAC.6
MGGTPRIRAIKVRRSYWTPQHLVLALSLIRSGESSQSRRIRGTKRRLPQERDNVFSLTTRSSYIHEKEIPERNFADPPPISTGKPTPTPSSPITSEPSLPPTQNSRPITVSFDCALLLNGTATGVLTEKSVVIDYTYTLVTDPELLQANESEEIVLTAVEEQVNTEVMSSLTECEVAETGRLLQSQKYMNQDQRRRTQIVDLKSAPNTIVGTYFFVASAIAMSNSVI